MSSRKKPKRSYNIKTLIEIQRVWDVKTKVLPVITEATGTISKSFR
jgi:hypothetical protein